MRSLKIGLALGGGGARGLAHIGVLKVLQREGVPIHAIAGTSMGAIVGGAFSLYQDAHFLEQQAFRIREKIPEFEKISITDLPKHRRFVIHRFLTFLKEIYLLNLGATRKWFVDQDTARKLLVEIFDEKEFSDSKIPFTAVSTDLRTGEEIPLREGKMVDAVLASMSIPGYFQPIEMGSHLLVDGGVTSLVPVDAVRQLGVDVVIAVNVERGVWRQRFDHGIDILFQVDDIRGSELNRMKLASADVVICPKVQHINWAQFSRMEEVIRRGEEAAREALPEIKRVISYKKRKLFLKRLFERESPTWRQKRGTRAA